MSHHLEDPFEIKTQKHVSTSGVKLTKQFKRKMWADRILRVLGFVLFVGAVILFALVFMKGPIRTSDGWIVPTRQNTIEIGSTVVATDEADNIGTRFKESWISPEILVTGEVIAGPFGVLHGEDGNYSIADIGDGVITNLELNGKHERFLKNEYIIRCTSGDCKVGKDYLFRDTKVKGVYTPKETK